MITYSTIYLACVYLAPLFFVSTEAAIAGVDECEGKGWITFDDVKRKESNIMHMATDYPFGYGNVPGVTYMLPRDTTLRRTMVQAGQVASAFIREGVLGALGATHVKLSNAMSSLEFKYIQSFDAVNRVTRDIVTPLARIDFKIAFSYDDLPELYLQKDAIIRLRRVNEQSSFQVVDFGEANDLPQNKVIKGASSTVIMSRPLFGGSGPKVRVFSPEVDNPRMHEGLMSAANTAFMRVAHMLKGKFRQGDVRDFVHGIDDVNLVLNSALYDDSDESKRLHTIRFSTILRIKDETHGFILYDADLAIVWDHAFDAYVDKSFFIKKKKVE